MSTERFHDILGQKVAQRKCDGYFFVTSFARAIKGKKADANGYSNTDRGKLQVDYLCEKLGLSESELIQTKRTGNGGILGYSQGTWVHPEEAPAHFGWINGKAGAIVQDIVVAQMLEKHKSEVESVSPPENRHLDISVLNGLLECNPSSNVLYEHALSVELLETLQTKLQTRYGTTISFGDCRVEWDVAFREYKIVFVTLAVAGRSTLIIDRSLLQFFAAIGKKSEIVLLESDTPITIESNGHDTEVMSVAKLVQLAETSGRINDPEVSGLILNCALKELQPAT